ncbi:MAG: NAD-dependent epimerase/dehydratase family protein [Flavobacteriaceae bacterium]|nr:NAD-dependent epimerase/dehydratase family protein [Flavobacteriaceae bacterium]
MILVTGGTGLVGSHLLYHLVQKTKAIRAIYRDHSKIKTVKTVFSYYCEDATDLFNRIEWVACDITNITQLDSAFTGVTHVYHCAAMVSFNPKDYHQLRNTNIEGTANIVNYCISNKVKKLCYVSSIATLGKTNNHTAINENTEWNKDEPHHVYAISKYGADMEVWRATQEGVDVVIIHPGIIIGPGYWNSSSGYIFKKIYNGFSYYTTGKTGYIDVNDLCNVMIKLMVSVSKNEAFIVVNTHLSFKDFSQKIASHLNVKAPNKNVSNKMLNIAWRLDWLASFILRRKRTITKTLAKNLNNDSIYDTSKLLNTIPVKFKPIDVSIAETCQLFLNHLK